MNVWLLEAYQRQEVWTVGLKDQVLINLVTAIIAAATLLWALSIVASAGIPKASSVAFAQPLGLALPARTVGA